MKKILFVILAVVLAFKIEAQKSFDFEIDGLGYTLISPSSQNAFWTAEVSEITEETIDVVVPEQVTYNGQVLDVVRIELWRSTVYSENKQKVRSIAVPNNVSSVRLANFPNLNSIAPIDELQELVLYNITSLSQLVVPNSILRIGISLCYSLHKLIILDGIDELKWVNGYGLSEGTFDAPIDTLYCGRNMDLSHTGYWINNNGFCMNLKSFEIGDKVTDLYLPHISDSLERLFVPKNLLDAHASFHYGNWTEVVIEDAYGDLINANHNYYNDYSVFGAETVGLGLSCKKLYIGRNVPNFGCILKCEQLILGPLTEYINLRSNIDYSGNDTGVEILGDSAYIKVYKRTPPEIIEPEYHIPFNRETYLNTPLYVPRGSLEAYRNSAEWGLFFNIIEFDWDEPYYQISAIGNYQYVKISGDRVYHEGDTATLSTRWQGDGSDLVAFYCWKENGEMVSRENPYSFVVDRDRTLEARYAARNRSVYIKCVPLQNEYPNTDNNMISYKCETSNVWSDVVFGQDSIMIGSFRVGSVLYLKAIPKDGDSFLAWKDEYGNSLCNETEYSFRIELSEKPVVLTAVFTGTGIEEGLSSELQTIVNGRTVSIIGAEEQSEIIIYNNVGQIVYKGLGRTIPIHNAGLYIVTVENKRIKVVVE